MYTEMEENQNQNKNLDLFYDALNRVEDKFVFFSPEEGVYSNHVERVFAYELYHQWGSLLKDTDLVLNAEINKKEEEEFLCKYSNGKGTIIRIPDLVLHHGQSDKERHVIVCEIKRDCNTNSNSIINDINKLVEFTAEDAFEKHPYRWGIMVVYGYKKDLDKVMKSYIRYIKKRKILKKEQKDRVIFVFVHYNTESHVPSIESKSLLELSCAKK